jgi:hypothetical protein
MSIPSSTPLESLDFKWVRQEALQNLCSLGYTTLEKVAQMDDRLLLQIRGISQRSLNTIKQVAQERGIEWTGKPITGKTPSMIKSFNNDQSIRDYFAAQALNAIISRGLEMHQTPDLVACWSYEYADAMMNERLKAKKPESEVQN